MRSLIRLRHVRVAVAAVVLCAGVLTGVAVVGAHEAGAVTTTGQRIVAAARAELGMPYCFAGGDAHGPTHGTGGSGCAKKTVGFDCSGLALYAYARVGITLTYHYTDNEYHDILAMGGRQVTQAQAAPGSLIFFHTKGDKPAYFHHVAIYSGNGMLIEAAGYKIPLREVPIYPDDSVVFVQPRQLNYWHGDDWFAHHGIGTRYLSNALTARNEIVYSAGWWGTVPLTGDWDGNGTDTAGFWDRYSGAFYVSNRQGGGASYVTRFGIPSDIPLVGDWTGTGRDSFGVYRPTTGQWFLDIGGRFQVTATCRHLWLYEPLVGDWDGNGTTTLGLRRVTDGMVFLSNTLRGGTSATFSLMQASDLVVPGDWDGNGNDTLAAYRPSNHTFYVWNRLSGAATTVAWGVGADYPIVGDWDGDGRTTLGLIIPSTYHS